MQRGGKPSGATPRLGGGGGGGVPVDDDGTTAADPSRPLDAAGLREWEEEQKRLDRMWYGQDEGRDTEADPFAADTECVL
jgi:hypothetical protein